MSKMVQIRHMPEPMHRKLKARAAMAGMPLSDYLLRELERSLARPTRDEVLERIRQRAQVDLPQAKHVRAERER